MPADTVDLDQTLFTVVGNSRVHMLSRRWAHLDILGPGELLSLRREYGGALFRRATYFVEEGDKYRLKREA